MHAKFLHLCLLLMTGVSTAHGLGAARPRALHRRPSMESARTLVDGPDGPKLDCVLAVCFDLNFLGLYGLQSHNIGGKCPTFWKGSEVSPAKDGKNLWWEFFSLRGFVHTALRMLCGADWGKDKSMFAFAWQHGGHVPQVQSCNLRKESLKKVVQLCSRHATGRMCSCNFPHRSLLMSGLSHLFTVKA